MTSNRENISVAGPARLSGPDLHLMDLASTNYNDRKPEPQWKLRRAPASWGGWERAQRASGGEGAVVVGRR